MTILVTGASGFLGAWTVRALAAAGEKVVALVRSPDPWRLRGVTGVDTVDCAPESWGDHISDLRPDVVLSFDWAGVAGSSRDDAAQWNNVERLRALADAAAAAGSRRFVGVGSQAEYGPTAGPITEETATHPATEYGRAKIGALSALRAQSGLEMVWARVFSVFGPLDNEGMVLQKIADATRSGTPIDLSTGTQPWSYLYASDAGAAMAALALSPAAEGVVNVGHPHAPALRESLTTFASILGSPETLRFAGPRDPGTGAYGLEPDVSRLAALGWSPTVTIDAGLTATAAWLTGAPVADPFGFGDLPERPATALS